MTLTQDEQIEQLSRYKFEPPHGLTAVEILMKAHELRVERNDHHINEVHVADAIELLLAARPRLPSAETSTDRSS